jgi:NADH dehydrogenase/NADH:ubiquinone oxidoreductase subunit G
VVPLLLEANALGVMEMGCLPDSGPGFTALKKKGKGYAEMKTGLKALVVAGNAPALDIKADFVIAVTSHLNDVAGKADLVLPATALYEKHGTIVNVYGTAKTLTAAQEPQGEAKDGVEILSELATALSKEKGFTAKEMAAGAKKVKQPKSYTGEFQSVAAKAAAHSAPSASALLAAMNKGMIAGSAVAKAMTVSEPALRG